ncbi:MAG: pseudouridine synthase [Candidatus Omnitrophota bacterium]
MKNNPGDNQSIRLNRLLAQYGLCSRRKADEWIAAGRVSINGLVCRQLGAAVDPETQQIAVDGVLLTERPAIYYIALNKPKGVVTTRQDPQGRRTVMDLLSPEHRKAGVFPVGRLDHDSEGLLLITNDGDWSQILLHPRHIVWKKYRVQTDKPMTETIRKKFSQGVKLEEKTTLPARVSHPAKDSCSGTVFHLSIREGRNRQIRRMCAAAGLNILSLKRLSVGPIELGDLPSGAWRTLTTEETQTVFHLGD